MTMTSSRPLHRRNASPVAAVSTAAIFAAVVAFVVFGSASSAGAASVSKTELEAQVLELTNEHRASVGCGPLRYNPQLAGIARDHSEDMAARDFFDHVDPDGVDSFQRIDAVGYDYRLAAENLAAGRWRPEDAVQQWLDSPPHRENLENCDLSEMGAGIAGVGSSTYRYYWTQVFATPTSAQVAEASAIPEPVIGTSSTTSRPPWRCRAIC